jgi:hypothetical protein
MRIINYINAQRPTEVSRDAAVGGPYGFLDVTGDDNVVGEHAMVVINDLNAHPGQQEAAADSSQARLPLAASAESASNQQSDDTLPIMLAADTASAAKRRR